jgi:hypothetical protein
MGPRSRRPRSSSRTNRCEGGIPGPVGLLHARHAGGADVAALGFAAKRKQEEAAAVALSDAILFRRHAVAKRELADHDEIDRNRAFRSPAWLAALLEVQAPPFAPGVRLPASLRDVLREPHPYRKYPLLVTYVKDIAMERHATAVLVDPTASIAASVHEEVVLRYSRLLGVGTVFVLQDVSALTFDLERHIIVTLPNVRSVLPADLARPRGVPWQSFNFLDSYAP